MENANHPSEYSLSELLKFLDFLAEKGLANRNTASSRKAACNKVLGILDASETDDLREVDLDGVARRFNNLEGTKYTPQSLQVYKSRVSTALSDFLRYKENPATFKTAVPKERATSGVMEKQQTPDLAGSQSFVSNAVEVSQNGAAAVSVQTFNLPIPLRGGVVVQLNGLPVDLTNAEAGKIAAVVQAMVRVSEKE